MFIDVRCYQCLIVRDCTLSYILDRVSQAATSKAPVTH